MNILLLGSGGREHAFALKISQSYLCSQLFIANGNAGTAQCGKNIDVSPTNFDALKTFSLENGIEMLVVGPEAPLAEGVRDFFEADDALKHIPVIGPTQKGAMMESSKDFAKEFMQRHDIPTAEHKTFDGTQLNLAIAHIEADNSGNPIVLKADGLAAGKGVILAQSKDEAIAEIKEMLGGKFGEASAKVVIEEFLDGIEFSVFALTDGKNYKILPTAKDYKRVGEGDTGLNTGGMGAVSPVPFVTEKLMQKVIAEVVEPTVQGLQAENIDYKGFIYFGLINCAGQPKVIEYNCRMGDPETEVVFPLIESDLLELFMAVANNTLNEKELKVKEQTAVTIILASGGYPEKYEKGKVITGIDEVEDSLVFCAGVQQKEGNLVTSGGRVIAVTSLANDMKTALEKSYKNAEKIKFDKKFCRKDIGFDL